MLLATVKSSSGTAVPTPTSPVVSSMKRPRVAPSSYIDRPEALEALSEVRSMSSSKATVALVVPVISISSPAVSNEAMFDQEGAAPPPDISN